AIVILADKNEAKLGATVAEFGTEDYTVSGMTLDVADEDAVGRVYQQVSDQFGRLDIMINAAGIVGPTNTPIADYDTAAFDGVYQVNLKGAFLMTKYAIPLMAKRNYGRILL